MSLDLFLEQLVSTHVNRCLGKDGILSRKTTVGDSASVENPWDQYLEINVLILASATDSRVWPWLRD